MNPRTSELHDDDVRTTIGTAARQSRKARRWTQEDVAECIGVTAEFYARIERGHALPSVQTLRRLADCLRVDADVLLGFKALPFPKQRSSPGRRDQVRTSGFREDGADWRKLVRRVRNADVSTLGVVRHMLRVIESRRQDP